MSNYIRTVQYYETDKMGVVHHSNYIRWFEEARTYYMSEMGYSYNEIEKAGIMLPVIAVDAEYKTGAKYGDTVEIGVSISGITAVKLSFSYNIKDSITGELRVRGTSTHCFVDDSFKPCSIKKKNPEFYNTLLSLNENLNK